jgi:antitoxin component of MazEF toxin-antitoxin module
MKTLIRRIGNSSGIIIPAAMLRALDLSEGDEVRISYEGESIGIQPLHKSPRYTLDELLSQCDDQAAMPKDLKEWDEMPGTGKEALNTIRALHSEALLAW